MYQVLCLAPDTFISCNPQEHPMKQMLVISTLLMRNQTQRGKGTCLRSHTGKVGISTQTVALNHLAMLADPA